MGFFDLFKNKKKNELSLSEDQKIAQLQITSYPIKILVAWGEAIDGNAKIRDWLMKNKYEELGMFCFALRNDSKAQDWLMKNGFPHLVALIKAIEGDKKARQWLLTHHFEILYHMGVAADGNIDSKRFLLTHDKVYAALSKKMEKVKDNIEFDNNSVHSINP
ncbi:MAG: hypothetical protein H6600_08865 [Flavobacteriales bacterium]|nr:hypothetical protein [Flavobacteriales bacterium]MCB9196359.1 hypothetical protein [Flavobacteriales bacterium]MCB9198558.1 hypothetical protein [Flavobacteriales bacterium]